MSEAFSTEVGPWLRGCAQPTVDLDAVALLGEAFSRIDDACFGNGRDHAFFSQYDAANGWGSAYGGLLFMARIMTACAKNPRKKVHVYA